MEFSNEMKEVFTALIPAQAEFQKAIKDKNNPFHKSKYADLANYIDACSEGLARHGLAFIQDIATTFETIANPNFRPDWMPVTDSEKKGKQPGPNIIKASVKVTTMIIHGSGQWIKSSPTELISSDSSAQSIGSLSTYARRYSLGSILGLAADDNDGNKQQPRAIDNATEYHEIQRPQEQQLDKTILRRYRADLNKNLQACKTLDQYKKVVSDFQNATDFGLNTKTLHNPTETFLSLASEHKKRIEDAEKISVNDVVFEFERLAQNCATEAQFEKLKNLFLENEVLDTIENSNIIDNLGSELNIKGYEKE